MEFRSLRYFLMVAREENITRAAHFLHLTQPTLSRQMMQLEEELGVKLFIRSNHRILLTEDGMLLKRRAQELVALAEKTKQDFQRSERALCGKISIGCGEFLSTRYLAKLISSFQEQYPLVSYQIYSGNSENIQEQIEQGILDFGIVMAPIDTGKYESISMPIQENWGIWVWADCPLAQKTAVTPEDLCHIPLISARGEHMYQEIKEWFGAYYEQLEIVASGNLLYNEAIMVQEKIGVVLGIALDCTYEGLCFLPLDPPVLSTTAMVWKKTPFLSNTTVAFIEHSKTYLKSILIHSI